jgi:hypothetical protein
MTILVPYLPDLKTKSTQAMHAGAQSGGNIYDNNLCV